tara:strand:- start:245 stop:628 length:384 start_codon:yes stop_codon:yes gene_type:complete
MIHFIIAKWDENNRPIKINMADSEEQALVLLEKARTIYPDAFYTAMPDSHGTDTEYLEVDSKTKTVTCNTEKQSLDAATQATERAQSDRRVAYQAESDHLFFEEQRGEVAAGTWAAKVDEIKARFPK